MNRRGLWMLVAGGLAMAVLLPLLRLAQAQGEDAGPVLIAAVYYDGFAYSDADEAVALHNPGPDEEDVSGWALSDGGNTAVILPEDTLLPVDRLFWLARDGTAFARQFGFAADVVLSEWPGFANDGDEVVLLDAYGRVVDALVYEQGNMTTPGWSGAPVQPYAVRGVFGAEGQILARKRDQTSGKPVPDSDRAMDWLQDQADPAHGRRVIYPGWDMETFFFPTTVTATATFTVAVAPDNAFESLVQAIDGARQTIQIETLTFENLALADALIRARRRGVEVTVLLEGQPVGGVPDQEKLVCQRLEAAGGSCWFMIQDNAADIADRYRYLHAKFLIIDERLAVISSENLSYNSMPDDEKADGTWGRRGVVLMTDAPAIVAGLARIFAADWDPLRHRDIRRWQEDDPVYGRPPAAFAPITSSGGITYPVRYPAPAVFRGAFGFVLQQAPENILRDQDGLLGLVAQAGVGDTILVQQLQERPYWGATTSDASQDPNLRLLQFVEAARRGATVRLLLDDHFDDAASPVSNAATCAMLADLAQREGLRLSCTRGNPAGLGIHNKMVLLQVNGRGYVHAGSWNGSELASKGNREVALLVQSDEAYGFLAEMFERDLAHIAYIPLFASGFYGTPQHVLISELLYDPYGADETEFVELVNPTAETVDLSGFSLGDALNRDDYEDVRRFPPGTAVAPGQTLVVATGAVPFREVYGRWPDFEILATSTAVADLIDDVSWGHTEAFLQLGNQGDEVILRDRDDQIIDAVAYGVGAVPDQVSCALLSGANHSLERFPYWQDSDDCPRDMRDWPFPSPGARP